MDKEVNLPSSQREPEDVRELLDRAPMSRPQILTIIMTSILSALDGYDILSVTYAAPGLARDWGLGPAELSLLFSSGLAGMGFGSLLVAPIADTLGRRKVLLLTLGLLAVGMFISAFTNSLIELAACRVVTGLGIGTMIALINPLSAEFANAKFRPMAVAIMSLAYPLGGTLGGGAAAALLQHYDWPAVFSRRAIYLSSPTQKSKTQPNAVAASRSSGASISNCSPGRSTFVIRLVPCRKW